MDNEEKNKKILAVVLVIILVVFGIYNLFFKKGKEEKIDTETIAVVKDNDRFYTVSSCVSKYLTYLSSSDTNNLYLLLNENYKKENNITKDNIYNYIGNIEGNISFNPRKMFEQRLSKNIYKYYVKGYIQKDTFDQIGEKEIYYIIVIMNQSNLTFSIMPYNGEMFGDKK